MASFREVTFTTSTVGTGAFCAFAFAVGVLGLEPHATQRTASALPARRLLNAMRFIGRPQESLSSGAVRVRKHFEDPLGPRKVMWCLRALEPSRRRSARSAA